MSATFPRSARVAVVALLVVVAGASLLPVAASARAVRPTDLPTIDPGALGPNAVDELSYDLGAQAFKPSGFPSKVELTAKVYAPQTITGRAPIVIIQHGRHVTCASATDQRMEWPCPASVPEVPSYRGYDALGRNLASHGIVAVSIGANGINANDGYLADGGASARAQLILEHLRRWKAWDASATGSPFADRFVGHIDLDDIGLMGHSRGGEGIAAAVQLNQRTAQPFGIKAALALAPVDFGRRVIGGVDLGVLLPYCDGDVSDLQGASYFDDGRYATPGDTTAKMTALLYGANHNFFNTVWTTGPGSFDDAGFNFEGAAPAAASTDPCAPGGAGRLSAAQQVSAGTALMAGFLRRHLQDDLGLQRLVTGTAPYPASTGSARWSIAHHEPNRLDVESWADASTYRVSSSGSLARVDALSSGIVCNPFDRRFSFDGAPPQGVFATACPMGGTSSAVNDTGVLDAGWTRQGPVVRQVLSPGGVDVTGYDGLRMRVAVVNDSRNTTRAKQDFSVVIEDASGARAVAAAGAGTNGLQRMNPGYVQHAVLNGVRLPLTLFPGIDLQHVRAVELRFDRTGGGRLSIADLAFTQEGTGTAAATTSGVGALTPSQPGCRAGSAARWACALAQLAWGRDPSGSELTTLAKGYPTAAGRRASIARVLASAEAAQLRHHQFVEAYIQDAVDTSWLVGSVSPEGRRTWEAATVELAENFAYASGSLSTAGDVVDALFEALLGRPADAAGRAYWVPRVDAHGPKALASSLIKTATYRGRVVDERYLQVLGRAADPSGRTYWVNKLATPGGEQALLASLLATEGFRTAATH